MGDPVLVAVLVNAPAMDMSVISLGCIPASHLLTDYQHMGSKNNYRKNEFFMKPENESMLQSNKPFVTEGKSGQEWLIRSTHHGTKQCKAAAKWNTSGHT